MMNIKNFEIICKKCGSNNVDVYLTINEDTVFECKSCNAEEVDECM